MTLLRYRQTVRTVRLELPDGDHRAVKVTTNEIGTTQHVEDGDVLHGTGRVIPIRIRIQNGQPRVRQAFTHDFDTGLWAPVPRTEKLMSEEKRAELIADGKLRDDGTRIALCPVCGAELPEGFVLEGVEVETIETEVTT